MAWTAHSRYGADRNPPGEICEPDAGRSLEIRQSPTGPAGGSGIFSIRRRRIGRPAAEFFVQNPLRRFEARHAGNHAHVAFFHQLRKAAFEKKRPSVFQGEADISDQIGDQIGQEVLSFTEIKFI